MPEFACLCIWDEADGCRANRTNDRVQLPSGVRRIDNNSHTIYFLCNTGSSIFITLFFNVAEIGSLLLLVFQTFSMRKETDISFFADEIRCLA